MRDITLEETIYFNFTTRSFSTGVPTSLLGTPVLSVLESNNATPITAGVSISVDRATVVGLNQGTVVATAANGYEAGKSYALYISTGTVGGVSVVGEVVAQFTVQSAASFNRLGAPAGASIAADLLAIDNFVDGIESTLAAGVALSATGLDAVPYTATGAVALAKATWTDTLTTYTDGMAGKRLKGVSAVPFIEGTINDAAATTTSFITSLIGYGTDFFVDALLLIEYAADKWQANPVTTYNTATGAMTFAEAFYVAPANGLNIVVKSTHIHPVSQIQSGLATQTSVDNLPTNAELATALGTADDATLAAIAALNNLSQANIRTAVGLASANLDTQLDALPTAAENAVAALTTQATESYRADGAAPTLAQAQFEILAHLGESSITGTTKTIRKVDGATTAATFTLDSATTPTSITRAT